MNSMNRFHVLCLPAFVLVGSLLLTGCDSAGGSGTGNGSGAGGADDSQGFKIDWGSGSVEIGGDGSVDVQAPGVDVKHKAGEGVSVQAADVDVNVGNGKGVQVKAPSVDVDVQSGDGSVESGRVKVNAGGVSVDTNPNQ